MKDKIEYVKMTDKDKEAVENFFNLQHLYMSQFPDKQIDDRLDSELNTSENSEIKD